MEKKSQQLQVSFDTLPVVISAMSKNVEEIQKSIQEIKQNLEPKNPDDYLTRKEVADLLKVDLSTIHNWVKKGALIPYYKQNRVYFKRSELFK